MSTKHEGRFFLLEKQHKTTPKREITAFWEKRTSRVKPPRTAAPVTDLSLHSDDEELHGEAQDVPGVKAVPNR